MARYDDVEVTFRHVHVEVVHDLERYVLAAALCKIRACCIYHARRIVRAKYLGAVREEL